MSCKKGQGHWNCHWAGTRGLIIIKFGKKKFSEEVLNVRKDLTKLSMEDLQLTGQGKLYINQSLCPYYRGLLSKSKSLHRMGKIFSYYVSNGTVKIKIQETSKPLSIMHISDLDKLFPNVDLSPTVWVQQYDNSIAIARGEFRVYAASGMDLFLIISIGMKQLDIVIGSSVLGVAGTPILPLAITQ